MRINAEVYRIIELYGPNYMVVGLCIAALLSMIFLYESFNNGATEMNWGIRIIFFITSFVWWPLFISAFIGDSILADAEDGNGTTLVILILIILFYFLLINY